MPKKNERGFLAYAPHPSLDNDQPSHTQSASRPKSKSLFALETTFASGMALTGIGLLAIASLVALPVVNVVFVSIGAFAALVGAAAYTTSMVLDAVDRKKNKRNSAPSTSLAPKPELGEQTPQQSKSSSQSIDSGISSGGVNASPTASFSSASEVGTDSLNRTLSGEINRIFSSASEVGTDSLDRTLGKDEAARASTKAVLGSPFASASSSFSSADADTDSLDRTLSEGTIDRLIASGAIGNMAQAQGASQAPSSRLVAQRPVISKLQAITAKQLAQGSKPTAHNAHYIGSSRS